MQLIKIITIFSLPLIATFAIPIVQFIYGKFKKNKKIKVYRVYQFDENLFNCDTDELKFESADKFYEMENNRILLNSRGWIRPTNGVLLNKETFEKEKENVFSIKLP